MSDLRGQVLTVNDQLSARVQEQLQELNDKVETIESATAAAAADAAAAAAMIIAVDGTAQEAVARLSEADQRSDPWSDWDILQCQEFYELEGRVAALEIGTASGPIESEVNPLHSKLEEALERIADLEGRAPGGYIGGIPRVHQQQRGRSSSVMDSKAIVALGPLTDDKNAFRQLDLKLINILNKSPGAERRWNASSKALTEEKTWRTFDQVPHQTLP